MKAWSWFAVPPVVLAAAYSATPLLVTGLTGHNAAAVTIAQLNLPADIGKPAPKTAGIAGREILYTVFGDLAQGGAAIPIKHVGPVAPVHVPATFALQSILMTNGEGVAVLNGNQVRQGDKVDDGYSVARIEPHAVWLTIKRTRTVKVGKKIKRETREELRALHFPEYRDMDMAGEKLAAAPKPQVTAAPEPKPGQIELEKDYKEILEKLKL